MRTGDIATVAGLTANAAQSAKLSLAQAPRLTHSARHPVDGGEEGGAPEFAAAQRLVRPFSPLAPSATFWPENRSRSIPAAAARTARAGMAPKASSAPASRASVTVTPLESEPLPQFVLDDRG